MLKKKYARIVPVVLIVLAGIVCLGQFIVYSFNYTRRFSESLKDAKTQLETLNATVMSEILSPSGVQLVQQSNLDLHIPANDGYLYSEYKFDNDDKIDVLGFYKQTLESLGWKLNLSKDGTSSKTFFYIRDSACLKMEIFSRSEHYRISIKHDFRKQSFGVKANNLIENLSDWVLFYNPCPP
jgi:hypothetical protein